MVNFVNIVGYIFILIMIEVFEILLDKSGGYLFNDVIFSGVFLDNMFLFEFGVLEMICDFVFFM